MIKKETKYCPQGKHSLKNVMGKNQSLLMKRFKWTYPQVEKLDRASNGFHDINKACKDLRMLH